MRFTTLAIAGSFVAIVMLASMWPESSRIAMTPPAGAQDGESGFGGLGGAEGGLAGGPLGSGGPIVTEVTSKQKLDGFIQVEFFEDTLHDVIATVAEDLDLDFHFKGDTVDQSILDQPVTIRFRRVRASMLLELILQPHNLDYLVRDDIIFITSNDDASVSHEVKVYNCRNLIAMLSQPPSMYGSGMYDPGVPAAGSGYPGGGGDPFDGPYGGSGFSGGSDATEGGGGAYGGGAPGGYPSGSGDGFGGGDDSDPFGSGGGDGAGTDDPFGPGGAPRRGRNDPYNSRGSTSGDSTDPFGETRSGGSGGGGTRSGKAISGGRTGTPGGGLGGGGRSGGNGDPTAGGSNRDTTAPGSTGGGGPSGSDPGAGAGNGSNADLGSGGADGAGADGVDVEEGDSCSQVFQDDGGTTDDTSASGFGRSNQDEGGFGSGTGGSSAGASGGFGDFGGDDAGGGAGFEDGGYGDEGIGGILGGGGGAMGGMGGPGAGHDGMGAGAMDPGGMGQGGMGNPLNHLIPVSDEETRQLIMIITHTIASDSWTTRGGAGTIAGYNGVIIVRQNPKVHEEIAELLAMLEESVSRP